MDVILNEDVGEVLIEMLVNEWRVFRVGKG